MLQAGREISNAHSLGLRRGTANDLLDTKLSQLGLQLIQLLCEIILALSPELTSLDLGRLGKIESACHSHGHIFIFWHSCCTYHGGRYLVEWLIVDVKIEDGPGRFGDVSVGLGLFFAPWRGAAAKRAHTHVTVAGASRDTCGGDDADPNRESAGFRPDIEQRW